MNLIKTTVGTKTACAALIFQMLCCCLVLTCAVNLAAQDEGSALDRDVLSRSDVVHVDKDGEVEIISASRSAKRVDELPLTVYVVKRDEILENGWTTLVDVLKSVPGIRVSQPGGGAEGETFLMRGLIGNNYTKFLINNIPVQPSTGSGMPIGAQLPVRQAERIEIIIGPASAIYGADAFAGVINIVTREAVDDLFVVADIARGNREYKYANFMVGGKAGLDDEVFNYSFYGSVADEDDIGVKHNNSGVYNPLEYFKVFDIEDVRTGILNDTTFQPYYRGTETEPNFGNIPHHSNQLGIRLAYKGLSLSFERMERRDHSSIGQSAIVYNYDSPANFFGETIQRSTVSLDYNIGPVLATSTLSNLQMRANPLSSYATTYSNNGRSYVWHASDDAFAEQLFTLRAGDDTELIGGFSSQVSSNLPRTNELPVPFDTELYEAFEEETVYTDSLLGDFGFKSLTFENLAAFAQLYQRWNDFVFIAGVRIDDNSLYGSSVNPRLAALWRLDRQTSLRASWGRAFRAPSTWYSRSSTAFVIPEANDSIYYAILPSPNLEAEQIHATELGISKSFSPDAQLDLVLFFNSVDKRIAGIIDTIDRKLYPRSLDSVARTYANGLGDPSQLMSAQASLRLRNLVPSIGLDLNAAATWSVGRETLPDDGGELPVFRMVPQFLGQLSVSVNPWRNWHLRADVVWSGPWTRRFTPTLAAYEDEEFSLVDGYATLDLLLRYHIDERIYVLFNVDNVFNTEYGGIGSIGWDVDLHYNPQRLRRIRVGWNFELD